MVRVTLTKAMITLWGRLTSLDPGGCLTVSNSRFYEHIKLKDEP